MKALLIILSVLLTSCMKTTCFKCEKDIYVNGELDTTVSIVRCGQNMLSFEDYNNYTEIVEGDTVKHVTKCK